MGLEDARALEGDLLDHGKVGGGAEEGHAVPEHHLLRKRVRAVVHVEGAAGLHVGADEDDVVRAAVNVALEGERELGQRRGDGGDLRDGRVVRHVGDVRDDAELLEGLEVGGAVGPRDVLRGARVEGAQEALLELPVGHGSGARPAGELAPERGRGPRVRDVESLERAHLGELGQEGGAAEGQHELVRGANGRRIVGRVHLGQKVEEGRSLRVDGCAFCGR